MEESKIKTQQLVGGADLHPQVRHPRQNFFLYLFDYA